MVAHRNRHTLTHVFATTALAGSAMPGLVLHPQRGDGNELLRSTDLKNRLRGAAITRKGGRL